MNKRAMSSYAIRTTIIFATMVAIAFLSVGSFASAQTGQADYAVGFEDGNSPFIEYQRVRRLWIDVEPSSSGVVVAGLYPNSPAKKMMSMDGNIKDAALEPDDVIMAVDGIGIRNSQDLSDRLARGGDSCVLLVRDHRTGRRQKWVVKPVWASVPVVKRERVEYRTVAASPSRLFAVVIAATSDENLGKFIESSLSDLEGHLRSNITKERLELRVLKDGDCSHSNFVKTLETLGSTSNDSLLVYYLGHGAYDRKFESSDPYGGHFLDFPGSDLLRKTVWDHMETTPARLRILVTDACNVQSIAQFPIPYRTTETTRTVSGRGATPLEWLLLGHKGRCDFGAASKGEYAWYSNDIGGWFTSQWIESSAKRMSWDEVKNEVVPRTKDLFSRKKNDLEAGAAGIDQAVLTQIRQQMTMTPEVQLTRVRRDSVDPVADTANP